MVKKLDDNYPELIDHIGWRLWNATALWKEAFDAGMVARGYPWFAEARSAVFAHLGRKGMRQSVLVKRMQLSKQAVQQLVDELVADGIAERLPDPEDGRGKIVMLTAVGNRAARVANEVKRELDAEARVKLGDEGFEALMSALRKLAPVG
jgi:DNA-binding MarR family transcriptional regulator